MIVHPNFQWSNNLWFVPKTNVSSNNSWYAKSVNILIQTDPSIFYLDDMTRNILEAVRVAGEPLPISPQSDQF